jgi:HEAT repeat protein
LSALALNEGLEAFDVLEKATQDDEPLVRRSAIQSLGQIENDRVLDIVQVGLSDSSPGVRLLSALTLAKIATPIAFQLLETTLSEGEKSLRVDAAIALGQTRSDIALELLKNSAQSELDPDVLRAINKAVAQIVVPRVLNVSKPPVDVLRRALEVREVCDVKNLVIAMGLIEDYVKDLKSRVGERNFDEAWQTLASEPQPYWLE